MASERKQPKIGDTVHAITRNTTTQVRTCRAGTYLEPADGPPRTAFPEGELGDKMYAQHQTGYPAKVSYVESADGTTKMLSNAVGGISYVDTTGLATGTYHLPEDCPYGI